MPLLSKEVGDHTTNLMLSDDISTLLTAFLGRITFIFLILWRIRTFISYFSLWLNLYFTPNKQIKRPEVQ